MNLGYDLYEVVTNDIVEFLNIIKTKNITLYRLEKKSSDTYRFYIPIYQRRNIKDYKLTYLKSIGILHYMLLLVKTRLSFIGCLGFVIALFISNQYIWDVQIIGNNKKTNQKVQEVLNELNIDVGDHLKSYQELNKVYDTLKDAFKQDIDYLNIYQSGSVLMIEYTNSKGATKKKLDFRNIYAKKDGVIKKVDVSGGNILVKENEYVKKGTLLVQNSITSTSEETKIIPVEGHVYAYTYQTIEASIDAKKMDKGEAFSYLLFTIRMKLQSIDKIDREKVVDYGIINNKIVLKMQYVLVEDIGIKGEFNEASN